MLSPKNICCVLLSVALAGCSTSLKELDDLSLINTKEVRAEQRVEEAEMKAEIAEKLQELKQTQEVIAAADETAEPLVIE